MIINKKKPTKKKVIKKVEEVVEEIKPEVQGYVVPVFFKREPIEKDIHAADIFYRNTSNRIELETRSPNYESKIEMIIAGDIGVTNDVGSTKMISKANSPKDWLLNLPNSNEFSGNPFIAYEVMELYEA